MATKSKTPLVAGVVVLGVLIGVPLIGWLLRSTIATSMARGELEAHGVTCDDRFHVELSGGFGEATIGPTRCEHAGGVLEAFELLGDVTVTLDGTTPASVEAESLRLVLREAQVRGGTGWAASLTRLDLEQRMAGVVKGLSEISSLDLPPTHATRVDIVRGEQTLGQADDVTLDGDASQHTDIGITRATFSAGPMGVGRLVLSDVEGNATPAEVTLRGRANARAGVAVIFQVERSGPFTLTASGLDTADPRFRLTANL